MKKLLVGLLAFGSLSAFATSTNYEMKHVNDDGSITIVGPKFSNPNGIGNLQLSAKDGSNLEGICKLFGQGSYVENSTRYESASGTLVRISRKGTFEKYDSATYFNAISSLICRAPKKSKVAPSTNAEKILINDDGSKTIYIPQFSNPDGNGNMRLSVVHDSNLDGICKLFGLGSYVHNSSRYEDGRGSLVRISRKGTFERFDSSSTNNALKSLICRE